VTIIRAWVGSVLVSSPTVRRSPVHRGAVTANEALTPRMRRITVRAGAMRELEIRPAQDVELHLRDATGRRVKRRYTIRHHRPQQGEIDLDVLLHGDWPGSTWGATARAGAAIDFQGPRGKLELRPAPWHLLVGDESALPAIAAICEALPPEETALAVIEVESSADELPIARADVRWVHRGPAEPGTADLLLPAVADARWPDGAGQAYLMGETRSMVALRALLEERGFAHESIFVKGYWNIARPDRIAGRAPVRA
jgi:NADPH-dependent ferric siderophore reductase